MYSPRTAKLRFNLRLLTNCSLVAAIAIIFLFIFAHFEWYWIGDLALLGVLFYFYFFFLQNRPIKLRCPHCKKIIRINTPWVCGFCQEKNQRIDEFPFVNRCEHCGAEPKAYQCHHEKNEKPCGKLIFLTEDELLRNYAFCLNSPVVPPAPTETEIERSVFETDKRRAEYKLHLARLNTEVELAEQAGNAVKKKAQTPEGKIEEHRASRRAKTITATEIYRNELTANAEKYKDDPEMLKWVNEDLEDWYKGGDWERII